MLCFSFVDSESTLGLTHYYAHRYYCFVLLSSTVKLICILCQSLVRMRSGDLSGATERPVRIPNNNFFQLPTLSWYSFTLQILRQHAKYFEIARRTRSRGMTRFWSGTCHQGFKNIPVPYTNFLKKYTRTYTNFSRKYILPSIS